MKHPSTKPRALSTEVILETALDLTEQGGSLSTLSMRKLGTALGADPTAVYRYFRSKDELITAIAGLIYSRMIPSSAELSGGWEQRLRAIADRVRAVCSTYPTIGVEVAKLPVDAIMDHPADRLNELLYGALIEAELSDDQVPLYVELFASLFSGIGINEVLFRTADGNGREVAQRHNRSLSAEHYPNINRISEHPIPSADDVFELGFKGMIMMINAGKTS